MKEMCMQCIFVNTDEVCAHSGHATNYLLPFGSLVKLQIYFLQNKNRIRYIMMTYSGVGRVFARLKLSTR